MGGVITYAALQRAPKLFHSVLFAGVPFGPGYGYLQDLQIGSPTGYNDRVFSPSTLATFGSSFWTFPTSLDEAARFDTGVHLVKPLHSLDEREELISQTVPGPFTRQLSPTPEKLMSRTRSVNKSSNSNNCKSKDSDGQDPTSATTADDNAPQTTTTTTTAATTAAASTSSSTPKKSQRHNHYTQHTGHEHMSIDMEADRESELEPVPLSTITKLDKSELQQVHLDLYSIENWRKHRIGVFSHRGMMDDLLGLNDKSTDAQRQSAYEMLVRHMRTALARGQYFRQHVLVYNPYVNYPPIAVLASGSIPTLAHIVLDGPNQIRGIDFISGPAVDGM
jgi:hypothetical protein